MNTENTGKEVTHLVDHLFRHETGKIVAVLTRVFGTHNLELAEDVVQDALLQAMNVWTYQGVPEQPVAWLYKVAKNKALNIVNREKFSREYVGEVAYFLRSAWTANAALDNLFSETEIQDDQLRMMFTCCHPSISADSQISLTLKTLCGFSIPEISRAFLTSEENINKRLVRARQNIRDGNIPFEIPDAFHMEERLDTVLQTIYLLFNEGYSASTGNDIIRYELCAEAMRLAGIIAASPAIQEKTNVYACLALMYLNASRFRARQNDEGDILTMAEQDRSLRDAPLIEQGISYLERSADSRVFSVYHILAAISAQHCTAPDFASTDWQTILSLYNKLQEADNSPVVLLNRAIALMQVYGVGRAIAELEQLNTNATLKTYQPFHSVLGEFYMQAKRLQEAKASLELAISLSGTPAERKLLQWKLDECLHQLAS